MISVIRLLRFSLVLIGMLSISVSAEAKTSKKPVNTGIQENHFQLCDRLSGRVQALKHSVRDEKDKLPVKQLMSDVAGLNFTTQIYLKLGCNPMKVLVPVYETYSEAKKARK